MARSPKTITRHTTAIFWNIWGSRHPTALNRYLERLWDEGLEIALLTEVTDTPFDAAIPLVHTSSRASEPPSHLNGLNRIRNALPKHIQIKYDARERRTWNCQMQADVRIPDVGFGSAMLYDRRTIKPIDIGSTTILGANPWDLRPRTLQWIAFQKGSFTYLVAHLHGVWIEGNTKGDHAARLQQSEEVTLWLSFLKRYLEVDKFIFGGDLNLDINTEALRRLERGGVVSPPLRLRNLIREFDIVDTRTSAYRKHGQAGETMYADYALVSSNVCVHDFTVDTKLTISDHAPLLLTFS